MRFPFLSRIRFAGTGFAPGWGIRPGVAPMGRIRSHGGLEMGARVLLVVLPIGENQADVSLVDGCRP